MNKKRR